MNLAQIIAHKSHKINLDSMFFYEIAPLKQNSPNLTYKSEIPLQIGEVVGFCVRNKNTIGVILRECEKPPFECKVANRIIISNTESKKINLINHLDQVAVGEVVHEEKAFPLRSATLETSRDALVLRQCSSEATRAATAFAQCATSRSLKCGFFEKLDSIKFEKQAQSAEFIEIYSPFQIECAKFISSYYCVALGLAFGLFSPYKISLFAPFLDSIDLDSINLDSIKKDSIESKNKQFSPNLAQLTKVQKEAYEFCLNRGSSLLFGDTGSGKSEIYFHLIAQCLKEGKSAIFLMPEISLTPQMERRLKAAFGEVVGFWHSKITKAKKQKILEQIRQNKLKILAGARSALFLPLQNLGLIVIDEEHDDAYKSSQAPCYHARDVALWMQFISEKSNLDSIESMAQNAKTSTKSIESSDAALAAQNAFNAPIESSDAASAAQNTQKTNLFAPQTPLRVVLGSATPSVSTYYKFKAKNAIFRLRGGHFESSRDFAFLPQDDENFSKIAEILAQNFAQKAQSIVFLPTRANFKYLICQNCGSAISCPNCAVSLSLHSRKNALCCHYCGFTRKIISFCEVCGGEFSAKRIGTQEFSKMLNEFFENIESKSIESSDKCEKSQIDSIKSIESSAKSVSQKPLQSPQIAILDRDYIKTQKDLEKTLNDFNSQKTDILLGTQMLALGHDYHAVRLCVVLGLDFVLKSSDFRANEKATSLLVQIAGRCARRGAGRVLVESSNKDFFEPFLEDYEQFILQELKVRSALYPPFARLALVRISHKNENSAKKLLQNALKLLQNEISQILQDSIESTSQNTQKSAFTQNFKDQNVLKNSVEIVGFGEAPIVKIANKFRFYILLRSHSANAIHKALSPLVGDYIIDIDPLDFV